MQNRGTIWRKNNRERANAYQRAYMARIPPEQRRKYQRRSQLKRKYGITLEDYERMLQKQNGHCALCDRRPTPERGALRVDHCHHTGRIRGLLCDWCNLALGRLGDTEEAIARVLRYLKGPMT